MPWPWVSRAKYEGLEDRYDDLDKRYKELQLHADKLLDSLLEHPEKSDEDRKPEKQPLPRRLLNREISAMASQAAEIRYQNSQRKA
jgi:hypothetical protein